MKQLGGESARGKSLQWKVFAFAKVLKIIEKTMARNEKDGKNGKNGKDSPGAEDDMERLLPPRGDYQTLLCFRKAEVVFDFTFHFVHKFLRQGDRTIDQMIQAARSGKKNILEGSKAARASKETELKLANVARGSLEELLDDYKDFLRPRGLAIWDKDSKEARYVRKLGRKTPLSYEDLRHFMETRPAAVLANIAICLINQTNYLVDRLIERQEKEFIQNGGLRERMTRMRLRYRDR